MWAIFNHAFCLQILKERILAISILTAHEKYCPLLLQQNFQAYYIKICQG